MGKAKLFIENFVIYGIGGVISRLIPLVMLPIITRLLPNTAYYGLSDLSNTVVSFGSAIAVLGMYDAMYRMFFEDESLSFQRRVCSTTLCFTAITSIIVAAAMVLFKNSIAVYFFGSIKYTYLVYISAMTTLVTATNQIVSAPTRMQNKRAIYIVANTVGPIISYLVAIPMMFRGHYVIALPLAALISGASLELSFMLLNIKWFKISDFNMDMLKQLLIIAVPLFPNFLIYWVFNSFDRVMITNLIGVGEAGIYGIGSKLGHVSQLIYTAFAGGWQYFAFSTMKDDDQVDSNTKVFEYMGIVSYLCTIYIFVFSETIFEILFTGDYIKGFIVAPYLFMAPLMQMLFQVAANQFIVIKKTWPNIFILAGGAIANIVLNYLLIPVVGIEGAAIATLLGYTCANIVAVAVLNKMKLMNVSKRFLLASVLMTVFILLWRMVFLSHLFISFIFACIITIMMICLYREETGLIIKKVKSIRR